MQNFKLKYKDTDGTLKTAEYHMGLGTIRKINKKILKDYGVELLNLIQSENMFTFIFSCLEVLHQNATGEELTDDILDSMGSIKGQDFDFISNKLMESLESAGLFDSNKVEQNSNTENTQEGK